MMMLKTIMVIMTPVFILVSVSLTSGQQHDDDYVDPTDLFNFDPVNVRMLPSKKSNTVSVDTNSFPKDSQNKCEQTGTCGVPHPKENDSEAENKKQKNDAVKDEEYSKIKHSLEASVALSRQYVNKLVYLLEPKVGTASTPVEINLRMKVSYHDVVKLRKFGDGSSKEIHDAYEILNYMVQFASESLQPESSIYWLEVKTGLSSEVLWHILGIVTCILLILIVLSQMTVTWRMLKQLLFLIFTVSVIFNWIELYQKHKADQEKIVMMEKLSDRCPKMDDLSFFNKITTYFASVFTFQEENCREYFQAMLVSPLMKASPMEAVSVAIVKTVVTPLGIIGNGIKAFFVGLLKDLPGQYQMFMIIILLVLIVLLLFFSSGYYFRILGLISLGPSENRHSIQGPPHTNQHHIENREYHHALGPAQLQLRAPYDQGMGLVEHQRTHNVPPVGQGYGDTAVAGTGTRHLDVSGPIEHGNRQRLTHNITDNVIQTDCEGTLAPPNLNMLTATGASQKEVKKPDNRQRCKQERCDGSRQEVATIVSYAASEGNLIDSRQQCKHESGDWGSLEDAKAIKSMSFEILQKGNLCDSKEKYKQESDDGRRQEVATDVCYAANEGNLIDSRQQCKHESSDWGSLEDAKAVRSMSFEILQKGNLCDSKEKYKQESGDGRRQEVATGVSVAANEGNLIESRQQCKHESGDWGSLERSLSFEILQEGNLSDSKEKYQQESGNHGDKYLVVTSLSSSSVANASLTKHDKNPDIKSGKDTEHVARESTDLPCTDDTSRSCDTDMVLTEGIESMNNSRNS